MHDKRVVVKRFCSQERQTSPVKRRRNLFLGNGKEKNFLVLKISLMVFHGISNSSIKTVYLRNSLTHSALTWIFNEEDESSISFFNVEKSETTGFTSLLIIEYSISTEKGRKTRQAEKGMKTSKFLPFAWFNWIMEMWCFPKEKEKVIHLILMTQEIFCMKGFVKTWKVLFCFRLVLLNIFVYASFFFRHERWWLEEWFFHYFYLSWKRESSQKQNPRDDSKRKN